MRERAAWLVFEQQDVEAAGSPSTSRSETESGAWYVYGSMWEPSFVAFSVLLGGTAEEAAGSLLQAPSPAVKTLLEKLCAPSKATRATALAEVLRDVAVTIERSALR